MSEESQPSGAAKPLPASEPIVQVLTFHCGPRQVQEHTDIVTGDVRYVGLATLLIQGPQGQMLPHPFQVPLAVDNVRAAFALFTDAYADTFGKQEMARLREASMRQQLLNGVRRDR